MRILTGKYKGKTIIMPKGIRPTQNKVRKAIFDILGGVEGLSFLELFSGSGAVGFEAASRSAREVVFVEEDSRCREIIKNNLLVIGLSGYRVIGLDSLEAIIRFKAKAEKFEIIFFDPPYGKDLAKKTLQCLGDYDILAPNGFIIAEHSKKEHLPEALGDLALFKQKGYGDTVLSFYEKSNSHISRDI